MFAVQLILVLACLYVGSRYGGIAFGIIAGLGLAALVFVFGLKPGNPPTDVIYIIIAAVTCAGTFQAAGGMEWLTLLAEKLLRKHPSRITFLAPFCTFFLTVLVGTGHVVYTLMPIIVDTALKNGERPERPCAVASVASQLGITASPIAAAVVSFALISEEFGFNIEIHQILLVTLPASIIGLFVASLCSIRRGRDLAKDPEFKKLISDPIQRERVYGGSCETTGKKVGKRAKLSALILLCAIIAIVAFAASSFDAVPIDDVIQIVMLVAAALMIFICRINPKNIVAGEVWRNGMVAVIVIYGVAWMADTLFSNYMEMFQTNFGDLIREYPWTIALVFFLSSVLLNSQGATVVAMVPVAYALGVPGYIILGALPCVYGYFFIPNYPSDIATVNFDRSGTTRIGKFLLNHSFMMPGLVSVGVSTCVSMLLSYLIFGPGF